MALETFIDRTPVIQGQGQCSTTSSNPHDTTTNSDYVFTDRPYQSGILWPPCHTIRSTPAVHPTPDHTTPRHPTNTPSAQMPSIDHITILYYPQNLAKTTVRTDMQNSTDGKHPPIQPQGGNHHDYQQCIGPKEQTKRLRMDNCTREHPTVERRGPSTRISRRHLFRSSQSVWTDSRLNLLEILYLMLRTPHLSRGCLTMLLRQYGCDNQCHSSLTHNNNAAQRYHQ